MDSFFSPVRRVSFRVENSRVGQVTDYDKLIFEVETNGVISPDDAIALAARILQDQLQPFINFDEPEVLPDQSQVEKLSFNSNLLKKLKLIDQNSIKLKILGSGAIKDKINIEADLASKSAVEKLEKIGGSIQLKK